MSNRTCSPVSRLIDSIRMQSRRNHNINFVCPFVSFSFSLHSIKCTKKKQPNSNLINCVLQNVHWIPLYFVQKCYSCEWIKIEQTNKIKFLNFDYTLYYCAFRKKKSSTSLISLFDKITIHIETMRSNKKKQTESAATIHTLWLRKNYVNFIYEACCILHSDNIMPILVNFLFSGLKI